MPNIQITVVFHQKIGWLQSTDRKRSVLYPSIMLRLRLVLFAAAAWGVWVQSRVAGGGPVCTCAAPPPRQLPSRHPSPAHHDISTPCPRGTSVFSEVRREFMKIYFLVTSNCWHGLHRSLAGRSMYVLWMLIGMRENFVTTFYWLSARSASDLIWILTLSLLTFRRSSEVIDLGWLILTHGHRIGAK